ncbi:MAG: DedA family protein [Solirubrobacteraceae bacterium]|nr:MAG: DedA family protein [Solirubrobacterales bacterium]
MLAASITGSLVTFATNVVHDIGLAGVFVLMTLESACIPIPSETTMLFAGANVSDPQIAHHLTLLGITVAGVAGNVLGSWIAYGVGYFGRLELVERHGSKLHIKPAQLARADRWFERYGGITVLVCRVLPVVRTFISLPAGVARMPFWRFTALTTLGCIPWVLMLAIIGDQVGGKWRSWKDAFSYADYVVAALVVVWLMWLIVRRVRRGGGTSQPAPDAG